MLYDHSLVIFCPVEHKATVEAAGVGLGHSGQEYTVPLSSTGGEPATHYGLHAWVTAQTAFAWTEADELPPLTPEQLTWLRSILVISVSTTVGNSDHFDAVLAEQALLWVGSEEPL